MIDEFGWLYKTKHSSNQYGTINCVVYSDIILCPNCGAELNLWEGVVDKKRKCYGIILIVPIVDFKIP